MRYSTLYFDLDNTLFDTTKTERKSITALLQSYGIKPTQENISLYTKINHKYWGLFEQGKIKKEDIFENRFIEFSQTLGVSVDTAKMSEDYFVLLSKGHDILWGAKKTLEYVKAKGYIVCITSNGVSKTQTRRINESSVKNFFDYVFLSDDMGQRKPKKEFFDYVIKNSPEKDRKKILIVGDSQSADVLGGINSGIDTCWLNPKGRSGEYKPTYEIKNISHLKYIL